ncbi:sirohydrochlorin chelatase [Rubritalea tangerina]|uniref:Sirohydrochlorin chelatase n=1 Tax=Rubritalea tangerina TaxID=430798 RepID=A0ABW4Z854_9BACT
MVGKREGIILLDNGSLRAGATLQLRQLAAALGSCLGQEVHPVSLLHSSKVAAEELGGEKAMTLVPFMRAQRELGVSRFIIVPLFFGPSGALVDYLPKRVKDLHDEGWAELEVEVAASLVHAGDRRVAKIMAELVRERIAEKGWVRPAVAMCDHGTPVREVNAVREIVAEQLSEELGDVVKVVRACSMERREGAEYDFNEPLLEKLLGQEGFDGQVVVSMLFAGPGRHAGAGGDVAMICDSARERCEGLETVMSDLVGRKVEALAEVLADRYREHIGVVRK